jgi:hypothetical protein
MIPSSIALSHKDCLTAIVPVFNYEKPFMRAEGSTPPSLEIAIGFAVSSFIESDFG